MQWLILQLIEFVMWIWYADSRMRDSDSLTRGSQFDLESRKFVARLCGGIVLIFLIAAFVWWFATRK